MSRATSTAQPWLSQIEAALARGDRPHAVDLAERGLIAGRRHPLALNLRALRAESEGRWEDALLDLDGAAELSPRDPALRNAVGLVLSRLGRAREAMAAYAAAVALEPGFAAAWRNLGMTQLKEGDVGGARVSLTRVSELTPADAEAWGQLAALAARRGEWGEAGRLSDAALGLDPNLASANHTRLKVAIHRGAVDAVGEELELWLSQNPVHPGRGRFIALLGEVRERQGLDAEAFAAFAEAGAVTRRRHAARFGSADMPGLLRGLEESTRGLDRRRAEPHSAELPGRPARHVFLMGFMRSGTTLLEQALAVRSDVVTLEEQEALASGVEVYLTGAEALGRLAQAEEAELDVYRANYWSSVRTFGVDPTGRLFVDKLPFNGVKIPLIQRLFPEAKIVFSVRDPRDVIISCLKHSFSMNHYTYQLTDILSSSNFYSAYMSLVEAYLEHFQPALRWYRHEDLVADFRSQMQSLCGFLGLEWREAMSDVGARAREGLVSSPSAVQLGEGLSREGLRRWGRYEEQLRRIGGPLERWVQTFGYGAADESPSPWREFRLTSVRPAQEP